MKITIDIDCTPAEARQFMGLPDLQRLQDAWLKEVEKMMTASLDQFSPENLARNWLSAAQGGADWFPAMLGLLRERGEGRGNKS